jgi:hypothetical protein
MADYMAQALRAAGWRVEAPGATPTPRATTPPRKVRRSRKGDLPDILDWYSPDAVARIERMAAARAAWRPTTQRSVIMLRGEPQIAVPFREELRRFATDREGGTAMLPQLRAL